MGLDKLTLETEYRSAQSTLAATFYRSCLDHATRYDRGAGYFSSNVFLVNGAQLIEFARRGGKMRMVCSPKLSPADIEALTQGHAALEDVARDRMLEEIEALYADAAANFPLRALATLVATGALDLRIAVRSLGFGMFHEKLGVFEDNSGRSVSFIGSANETWCGWHQDGNYEAIEVFSSWNGDDLRIAKHRAHFARIWDNRDAALLVLTFPEAARRRLCEAAEPSLEGLITPPATPTQRPRPSPRLHQSAALEAWARNGYRGIFEHATGSGKTLTALFAAQAHIERGGVVLILVPSKLLLDQWHDEVREYFGSIDVLLVGSGHGEWRAQGLLRSFTSSDQLLGGRIVLAMLQTARSDDFLTRLRHGDHLLLVADEVHQLGSMENSKALTIRAGRRLGLSATPQRYGDPSGTAKLLDYFSGIIPPPYTLNDAIDDGHLVPYEYYAHVVSLTEDEAEEWQKQTHEISKLAAREGGVSSDVSDLMLRLLIRRSRIAKKAINKLTACQTILREHYVSGQRWLVYCDDSDQLSVVVAQTRKWCPHVLEYHTAMVGDPRATLQWFQEQGGILVAIACLDEGVNIPSISHALVLASSQNPRQFIQRRGRILRRFPGKRRATIHDVLVSPEGVDTEPTQKSLLRSELRRACEFANSAVNSSGKAELRLIAVRAGMDPASVDDAGTEWDEMDTGGADGQ